MRDQTVITIRTTPAQDDAIVKNLSAYRNTPLGTLTDNCTNRTLSAIENAGVSLNSSYTEALTGHINGSNFGLTPSALEHKLSTGGYETLSVPMGSMTASDVLGSIGYKE